MSLTRPPAQAMAMTKTFGAITAALLIVIAAGALAIATRGEPVPTGRLSPAIGPADATRYRAVRDGAAWQNPYLVVHGDGVEIITKRPVRARHMISVGDLPRILVELPVVAWPYGRVAAVQEASIRPPEDDARIRRNLEAAAVVLKELGITFDGWPA